MVVDGFGSTFIIVGREGDFDVGGLANIGKTGDGDRGRNNGAIIGNSSATSADLKRSVLQLPGNSTLIVTPHSTVRQPQYTQKIFLFPFPWYCHGDKDVNTWRFFWKGFLKV